MKKSLLFLSLLISGLGLRSQSLTISTSTTSFCYNGSSSASNSLSLVVVTTPSATAFHGYNVVGGNCSGSATVTAPGTGSSATILFPCCGQYTVYASAFNSGGYNIAGTSTVVNIGCSIGISSPNNFLSCNGSTVVMNASGGTNYLWSDASGTLSTSGTLAASPTVNTCYTLTGTSAGCSNSAVACVTVSNQTPTITISGVSSTTANCQYSSYSMTASGATNYTWVPNWLGYNATAVGSLGTWPCYTVIGTNGGACTSSAVICPSVTTPPAMTITANPSPTVCAGTPVTLSANSGPSTYTWSSNYTTIGNGSTIAVTPTNYPNQGWNSYTLSTTYPNGCNSYGHIFLYLTNGPSVTVSGGTLFCSGQSKTLTVSGSGSFTWTSPSGALGTGNSVVVSPTASTCYTVSGSSGCQNIICLSLVSPPSLTVTATPSSSNNCAYSGYSLSASGANSYSWFYSTGGNFANSANTVVGPASNSCYTVIGTSAPGCTASAGICVTVNPGPAMSVSISPGLTVCPGTQVNLSGSGASNYTYALTSYSNIISTASTASFTATSGNYSVWVIGTSTLGCPSYSLAYVTVSSGPGILGAGTGFVCSGGNKTLYTNSSGPHTWSGPSGVISTGSSVVVSPTVTTCYTLTSGGVGTCSTSVVCISPAPGPTITATGYSFCQGSNGFVSVSGGTFYSVPGFSTTNSWISIGTVNSNTCITVTGIGSNGCTGTAVACVTVTPPPVLTNTMSSKSACLGQSVLLGTSNMTVSWNVSQLSQWFVTPVLTHTGTSVAFTPTASGVFSVTAYSGGCYPSFITTINIVPNPTLSIAGSNTVCAGGTLSLNGSGANTYTWSNAQTGANIIVSPAVSQCYTLTGTNSAGCIGTAVHCVSVVSTPLLIGPSSATVCKGTSQTFTASGAFTYTWSTLANTSTVNLMPLVTTSYSVTGTGANGCTGMSSVTLVVDTTCSNVWPGDANSDGIVGTTDVLEIGLAFSATGSARNPGGNSYVAQRANNWSGTISTGKNKCHADCNGDGTVSMNDTMAIFNNFGISHGFRSSGSSGNDITVVPDQPYYIAGTWGKADIYVGDANNQFQLYGLTFDIDYSNNLVDAGQAYLVYTSSFLNASNQNVEFRKKAGNGGKFHAASVRTDHADVTGQGKIAELHFKLLPGTEGQFMNLSIGNSIWINTTGVHNPMGGNGISVQIAADETGLAEQSALNSLRIFPNPTSQKVTLLSASSNSIRYLVSDISGRILTKGDFTGKTEIATDQLAAGVYFIRYEENGQRRTERLVIHH